MTDFVNHPPHYADGWSNGAEVIDITENLNFNLGNAVKYIARAGKKDAGKHLEDLRKAQWYLNREIDRVQEAQNKADNETVSRTTRNLLKDVPPYSAIYEGHNFDPLPPTNIPVTWQPLVSCSKFGDRTEVHIEALHMEDSDVDYLLIQLDSAYVEVRDELLRRNQRGRNE